MTAMLADLPPRDGTPLRRAIDAAWHQEEAEAVAALLAEIRLDEAARSRVQARARELAVMLRAEAGSQGGVEAFMRAYSLDTHEGIMLMCLAEALLRIPDRATQDRLIRDKLTDTDWQKRIAQGDGFLLNAGAFGLMISGRILSWDQPGSQTATRIGRLVAKLGEPVMREALRQAMRVMGRQFVLGQTIDQAVDRATKLQAQGFLYSYDMLGEGARTMADARRYLASYQAALARIAAAAPQAQLMQRPSLSIKLSALHPRYEYASMARLRAELLPALESLLAEGRRLEIAITIDAEESERLEPSLDLLALLAAAPALAGWNGLGLAVQAYQKRALPVVAWLADLATSTSRRIPVRLVKGAYWDAEIKRAQALGHAEFPVFTRKIATDVSYIVCAGRLLAAGDAFWPQFATHNAHTIAAITELAGNSRAFEFQKLHGMGDALYVDVEAAQEAGVPCRVYAPVGSHEDLLPYLVRRLLENGANSSFVHRVVDPGTSIDQLIADPVRRLEDVIPKRHPSIPLPADLFGGGRRAAIGPDLAQPQELARLRPLLEQAAAIRRRAMPDPRLGTDGLAMRPAHDPADRSSVLGEAGFADAAITTRAVALAAGGFPAWAARPVAERAAILERAAGLYEANLPVLMALCIREAGKTLGDALADVREGIDFLRYYAVQARLLMAPQDLPGPTGESNRLSLHPRGVFAAISPWNFPVAIFTGQVAAALVTGNAVIAKPAEQTCLTAAACIDLLHEAGVPRDALLLLPGDGPTVGAVLTADPHIAGIVFTGGTDTARAINRAMAATDLPIRPLIAETGGLNALVVDNSALPEQVVADAVESAFRSAGQRCSALRLLCLQREIAPRVIQMLKGAMDELVMGDPGQYATDVGPVIDDEARAALERQLETVQGRVLHRCALGPAHAAGSFFPPTLVEIAEPATLTREAFGPILHVATFDGDRMDALVDEINASGYGLTFGIHSRIDDTIERVTGRIRAGNLYVNRNIIGAVVGSQPFGGEGLSGTGFKAGGPSYLLRFTTERTLTVNTTAAGGNLALLGKLEG